MQSCAICVLNIYDEKFKEFNQKLLVTHQSSALVKFKKNPKVRLEHGLEYSEKSKLSWEFKSEFWKSISYY